MNQHKRNTEIAHQAIRKKSDATFKRVIAIINELRKQLEVAYGELHLLQK